MRHVLLGILVGLLLLILGTEIITFVFRDWLGLWPGMTQTDALLALVIVLLSVVLCRLRPGSAASAPPPPPPPNERPRAPFPRPAARRKP